MKITDEMQALEQEKVRYTKLARLHDLKYQRLKLINNLQEVEEEIEKQEGLLEQP